MVHAHSYDGSIPSTAKDNKSLRLMPRYQQIYRKVRLKKTRSILRVGLEQNPQKRGICLRVSIRKPKKPNSALRKICKVRLLTGRIIQVGIPGIGHNIQEHSVLLIRGGRVKDCPGIKYKVVRGVFDCSGVLGRKSARSKYGCRR